MNNRKKIITKIFLALSLIIGISSTPISTYAASEFKANSPYGSTGTTRYTHKGKFSGHLIAHGVDVSTYQSASSDWNEAKKKNGVDFAILRVTWTGYGSLGSKHNDDKFKTHYKKAKKAGLMVGAYVFSQAKNEGEAIAEAKKAVDRLEELGIGPEDLDLPIYMDYEFAGPSSGDDIGRLYVKPALDKEMATKCAKAFCDTVKAAGYEAGIYANTTFFRTMIDHTEIGSNVDLWCAQYNDKCTSKKPYKKWQFTSSALINGIYSSGTGRIGRTDGNFWYIKRNPKPTDSSDIAGCDIYGATDFNYTGDIITPEFEVISKGKKLVQGKDYTIGYINNVKKGNQQAYAYIRGIGSYKGYALIPFTIGSGYINRIGLKDCKYTDESGTICYIFRNVPPEADGTDTLEIANTPETQTDIEGIEETPDAANSEDTNTSAQTETVGSTEETDPAAEPLYDFEIGDSYVRNVPTGLTVKEFLDNLGFVEGYENYSLSVINTRGNKLSGTKIVKTGVMLGVYKDGVLIGTADITVNGDRIKNRLGKDPRRPLIKISTSGTRFYYTGRARKPSVKAYFDGAYINNSNVSIRYSRGSTRPGRYKVYVKGKTYPGYTSRSYSIVIKPATIYRLSALNKGFNVRVNKYPRNYVSGYQVRYSTNSGMSSSKTRTIGTSYNKVSRNIRRLRGNRTYYVQVRSYKKIGRSRYYSSWSKATPIKTK
ncbi:MAG TPA: hypothetical protein GX736_02615 [Mogibacterium sp.]|nr:hypothetical protein [Mogibacterium sp.]